MATVFPSAMFELDARELAFLESIELPYAAVAGFVAMQATYMLAPVLFGWTKWYRGFNEASRIVFCSKVAACVMAATVAQLGIRLVLSDWEHLAAMNADFSREELRHALFVSMSFQWGCVMWDTLLRCVYWVETKRDWIMMLHHGFGLVIIPSAIHVRIGAVFSLPMEIEEAVIINNTVSYVLAKQGDSTSPLWLLNQLSVVLLWIVTRHLVDLALLVNLWHTQPWMWTDLPLWNKFLLVSGMPTLIWLNFKWNGAHVRKLRAYFAGVDVPASPKAKSS